MVVQKNTFILVAKEQIALRGEKFGFARWFSNFSVRWVEVEEGMAGGGRRLKGNGKKCNRKRTITRKKIGLCKAWLSTIKMSYGTAYQIA